MSAEPVRPDREGEPEGADPDARLRSTLILLGALASRADLTSQQLNAAFRASYEHVEHGAPAAIGSVDVVDPQLRLIGRARKVSVSMPEHLTTAVQQRVGRGAFSQYVTEAVAMRLELDLLGELSSLLDEEYGPVSEEALAEARRSWPDAE